MIEPSFDQPLFRIDPMLVEDVAEVSRVERRCFTNPWPISAYRRELQSPDQNYYIVLREEPEDEPAREAIIPANGSGPTVGRANGHGGAKTVPRRTLFPLGLGRRPGAAGPGQRQPPVIGFAGMWTLYDESHITTIAVEPDSRGRGLGELLLVAMFGEAIRRGANWLTLEVRVSNEQAQRLYLKYGFTSRGRRKRYYSDNNEDALIMWSDALQDPDYQAAIDQRAAALLDRLGHLPAGLDWPTSVPGSQ